MEGEKITVPQVPTHGMSSSGPNNANNSNTKITESLLASRANAEFDDQVGSGIRKRKTKRNRKRKSKRRRKTKKEKNRGKSKNKITL